MKYSVGEKVIVNGYEKYEGVIEEVDKDSWLPYFVRIPTANKSYWVTENNIEPMEPSNDEIPTSDWSLPASDWSLPVPHVPPKQSDDTPCRGWCSSEKPVPVHQSHRPVPPNKQSDPVNHPSDFTHAVPDPKKESDPVNHPSHYTQGDVECIDAIKAATESLNGYEGFLAGNCMKYIWRFKAKNGKEDLEKAGWYLKKLMEVEDVHD